MSRPPPKGGPNPVPSRSGLLDRNGAAEYLAVGLTTLRRLVDAKEIHAVKVRSATRYAVSDLDAYIERLRRSA